MPRISAPTPHIGQLLLGHEQRGRSDVLYYLVLGKDGSMTIWTYVSGDHGAEWERPPICFNEFDQLRVGGVLAKQLIAEKLNSISN